MRKIALLTTMMVALLLLSGCGMTIVEPGYVGIKVNQWGGNKGVDATPILTGRVMYNPITETIYEYPIFKQRVEYKDGESICYNAAGGSTICAPIAVSVGFKSDMVPHIFQEYRIGADALIRGLIHDQIRNAFNEAAGTRNPVDIISREKEQFHAEVERRAKEKLEPKGFIIDGIALVGDFQMDDRIRASINAVIEQEQLAAQARAAVERAKAEAESKIEAARGDAESTLVRARSQAEANELVARTLSMQLVQYEAVQKWNGQLPQFQGGSGAVPFINVPTGGGK